jgi:multidrug resistance efflux pump
VLFVFGDCTKRVSLLLSAFLTSLLQGKRMKLPALHRIHHYRWLCAPIVFLVLLLQAACSQTSFGFKRENPLLFSGTLETREIRVGSKAGGRVVSVLVEEGQAAKSGDPLVRLDMADLEAQRTQAAARIAQHQARLMRLLNGARLEEKAQAQAATATALAHLEAIRNWPRPEEVEQARAAVAAAEAELNNATTAFNRVSKLRQNGDIAQSEFDAVRYRVDTLTARRDAEKKRLDLLLNGSRKEDIRAAEERYRQSQQAERLVALGPRAEEIADARAQLAEAQARLKQLEIQLAEGQITAPVDATVEVLSIRPGDLLTPNQPVARLLESNQLFVRIYVPEPQLNTVKVGQKAKLKIDSGEEFEGVIEQISTQGEFTPRNVQSRNERNHLVFAVKVRPTNRNGLLKVGMTVEVALSP